MILRIELQLEGGAYMVHLVPGTVESVRIESRGESGAIHMKSGQEYTATRQQCLEVLAWRGYVSPSKE